MIEVEITNYQSISHAKFVVDGFTTLVGRNTIGKSSTLRAINAALTNQQGMDCIKWGETFCEVHLTCDGLDIVWHKEEGNNFYQINGGDRITKIGREDPPKEILEAGFKVVKISDQKINLNYVDQFNPLFLIDKQDSKGLDLLTAVYGLDRLYKAVDLCSKEQRDTTDLLRLREKDLEIVNRDMSRFKNFEDIKNFSDALNKKKSEIDTKKESLTDLKSKYEKIIVLVGVCKRLKNVDAIALPGREVLQSNFVEYKKLLQYHSSVSKIASTLKIIKPVLSIDLPLNKVKEINSSTGEYRRLSSWYQKKLQILKGIDRLKSVDEINIPKLSINANEVSSLKLFLSKAREYKTLLLDIKNKIGEATVEIDTLRKEKSEYKVCPLCKNRWN